MVAPGFIETDMTSNLRKQNSGIESLIPLGRYGKAHEVAEAVCFLAEATYMTGQVYHTRHFIGYFTAAVVNCYEIKEHLI